MRPHIREIVDYLRSVGADDVHEEMGGKHPRIVYRWKGREQFYVVPGSPSDSLRGVVNATSDLRRILGLAETQKRIGERRKRRAKPQPRTPEPPVSETVLPDWRDRLAEHPASIASIHQRLDMAWKAWWREIIEHNGGRSLL